MKISKFSPSPHTVSLKQVQHSLFSAVNPLCPPLCKKSILPSAARPGTKGPGIVVFLQCFFRGK